MSLFAPRDPRARWYDATGFAPDVPRPLRPFLAHPDDPAYGDTILGIFFGALVSVFAALFGLAAPGIWQVLLLGIGGGTVGLLAAAYGYANLRYRDRRVRVRSLHQNPYTHHNLMRDAANAIEDAHRACKAYDRIGVRRAGLADLTASPTTLKAQIQDDLWAILATYRDASRLLDDLRDLGISTGTSTGAGARVAKQKQRDQADEASRAAYQRYCALREARVTAEAYALARDERWATLESRGEALEKATLTLTATPSSSADQTTLIAAEHAALRELERSERA